MTLEETLAQIKPLDKNAMDVAAKRWDSIAKPLHSLGKMEKLVIQIAGNHRQSGYKNSKTCSGSNVCR